MRLRQRDQKAILFKQRTTLEENDGTTYEGWGEPITIYGNLQPAAGRLMSEMYGERIGYMLAMYVEGKSNVLESSGAWIYVTEDSPEPDYRVVAVRPWGSHTVIDLEKVTV